ncbi:DUF2561 family protein [Mycobacterium shimoidei]|uniref:Uncharacterized protein n=1 Tax=Mycobacterium shimoidei TaxID=29313 RepID=A0A1E3TGU6_MYCSH|nr:DUF2561 family protein [Mycobacterium shimoidei]MCV7261184.1 DUF2561 family protein [Mycobacterium shimoidei]ODR13214.1 hypothetical protein BHQ16_12140 [Mycobacterium shimoidei]ORW82921.1 hypothetical protein AWC26_03685 [Mycobacterium shimoidei]SRX94861.1 hypothetical protein MSP7336_03124 [Mycobacterium shimoidei]
MVNRYSVGRRGWATMRPTTADRILIGACAAVWLALIGMSVAALVALIDLGRGFHESKGDSRSSAVLYVVIVISALVILAAIPLLLRARRTTRTEPTGRSVIMPARDYRGQPIRPGYPPPRTIAGQQDPTERLTTLRRAGLSDAELERIWLRGSVGLLTTMGVALIGVAAATYLMAVGHQAGAWTMYVLAGIVTVTMPLIPWLHVRQLRRTLAEHQR